MSCSKCEALEKENKKLRELLEIKPLQDAFMATNTYTPPTTRMVLRRSKNITKLMVDSPTTGELVFWRDLGTLDKQTVLKKFFFQYVDDAYCAIMHSLVNIDEIADEFEVAYMSQHMARRFLSYLCGYDIERSTTPWKNGADKVVKGSGLEKFVIRIHGTGHTFQSEYEAKEKDINRNYNTRNGRRKAYDMSEEEKAKKAKKSNKKIAKDEPKQETNNE